MGDDIEGLHPDIHNGGWGARHVAVRDPDGRVGRLQAKAAQ